MSPSIRDLMAPAPPPPAPFIGTPWWERRMIGFDLETTHADPEDARIVVAAVVEVGAGQPSASRSWLVDPDIDIPAEATAVHGITSEQARAGELAGDAIPAIVEAIAHRPPDGALVIFNAPYDLVVLDREARRCGVDPLTGQHLLGVVDPLVIDKHLDRYRQGSRKLMPTAQHYRAHLDGDAHDADFDALLACRLAWVLATKARVVRRKAWEADPLQAEWDRVRPDLAALHFAQIEWARLQRAGLAAHFRAVGSPAVVRPDWPLVPC